jgi:hypothetical protein
MAQSSYGKFVEEKNLFPFRAETQFLGHPACVVFHTQYCFLPLASGKKQKKLNKYQMLCIQL